MAEISNQFGSLNSQFQRIAVLKYGLSDSSD